MVLIDFLHHGEFGSFDVTSPYFQYLQFLWCVYLLEWMYNLEDMDYLGWNRDSGLMDGVYMDILGLQDLGLWIVIEPILPFLTIASPMV